MILANIFKEGNHFEIRDMGYKTPCYIWLKALRSKVCLYASYTYMMGAYKNTVMVHKYLYELQYSRVPIGLVLDHLCNNKNCINIEHLEVVTYSINTQRGFTRGRNHKNSLKTHCPQGHEYTKENTTIFKNGRLCKTCKRNKDAIRYASNNK